MLKQDLAVQTMNQNAVPKSNNNINNKKKRLMKDKLSGKIMTKFVGLRAKTSSYLVDDGSEDRKLKFENYKSSLEAILLENKINYSEKKNIDINGIKEFV